MAAMGSKIEAKRRVRESGVPVVPGYDGDDQSLATLARRSGSASAFRCLIKASAGGGGRGMRVVESLARLRRSARSGANAKRWPRSATMPCCSSAICAIRATSSFRSSPTRTARRCISANANARFSAAIRRSSRKRRRSRSRRSCAPRWARRRCAPRESVGYVNAGTVEFMLDSDGDVLFPRDERAPASRASGHRAGLRRRSRALATAHRRRRTR